MQTKKRKQILLVGNPNVGKSTVFNILCNQKQKTANYAGVTVASYSGKYIYKDETVEVIDLPGSYSIYPTSEDEAIFSRYLIQEQKNYSGIIYIVDAINLRRSLFLFRQIQDLKIPSILIVNQIDEAKKRGARINIFKLSEILNIPVFETDAKHNIGVENLREIVFNNDFKVSETCSFEIPLEYKSLIHNIYSETSEKNFYKIWTLLAAGTFLGKIENSVPENSKNIIPKRLQVQETIRRYQNIDKIISEITEEKLQLKKLLTEKLDKILVHKFWGYIIFLLILLLIFQSVFFLAEYPMSWIESFFTWFSGFSAAHLPEGPINSLISDGILPGIGGIMVFAPQIGILLYFLYLLEDSGYMARVVFLMDRLLRPFGLNGKSIVPLVSGTACAIPAIMSARNIENIKERLITILVTPFMTCSARLPVYSIIIGLIIPNKNFFGIKYRALALMTMYLSGFLLALFSSFILKNIIKTKIKSFLVMDLPAYKVPLFGYDFKLMLAKVWDFITGAGKVIFTVSIILWALSYFGPSHHKNEIFTTNSSLDHSYLGKLGRTMEPAIAPLGYDWKMGVGILTSFAAREVFVGTLSTLYSLDDKAPEGKLIEKMRLDKKSDGEKVFSFATGVSILFFYMFAMQCISTIAVVYRETGSLKWTLLQSISMTIIAYFSAFFVFQILK